MRVIVAAAGPQTKWGGYLGVRSHFAPARAFLGSGLVLPLLELALMQAVFWSRDVWLVAPGDEPRPYESLARFYGARTHVAQPGTRNEFESTRTVWAPDRTNVLLLGDVWWTPEAFGRVFAGAAGGGFRFYGREQASTLTGTPYGEIFAQSWTDSTEMGRLTDTVRSEQDSGRADRTKHGWTMLRMLQGTPLREHLVQPPWWVEVDDATDDIDVPADYRRHPATRGLHKGGSACA
ncbi:hypothetical protein OG352_05225 [Streptomyces sp. NBC_01485]|uniref:hypothetical protein n=1 Tax=Streptomyces sp. NBC_01485 TaxID=2903884 RepID=UPI002E353B80|nr:hypothetical protein [Streptomyces sp. NBC_01485]